MALFASSANHRSIRLRQEEPVGMKCSWKRGCLASQALTLGVGVDAVVVEDQMQFQILGKREPD